MDFHCCLLIHCSSGGNTCAGISFSLFPNKVFDNIIVRTNLEYGVKDILMKMAADIRSATKPDLVTNAIVIYNTDGDVATSGNRIDIYSYNDNEMYYKYNKVSYKWTDFIKRFYKWGYRQ